MRTCQGLEDIGGESVCLGGGLAADYNSSQHVSLTADDSTLRRTLLYYSTA